MPWYDLKNSMFFYLNWSFCMCSITVRDLQVSNVCYVAMLACC